MGLFKRKLKDPVDGTVQIASTTGRPIRGVYGVCRMQVVVQAPGIEAFATEHNAGLVRASQWPVSGSVLAARVDRTDPERFEILWDQVPTREQMAEDQAEAIAASLRGEPSPGSPVVPAGVPPEAADVIAKIQQQFPGAQIHVQGSSGMSGMVTPAATKAAGDDDRIAQLERLAKLHDSGALSDAEFETEKRRVLSGES